MIKALTAEQKRKAIIAIYNDYGCMSSEQASCFIKRKMGLTISSQAVAGVMKSLYARGYAGNSKNEKNTTIYWLSVPAWEIEKGEE